MRLTKWHASRVFASLLPVDAVNYVQTLKALPLWENALAAGRLVWPAGGCWPEARPVLRGALQAATAVAEGVVAAAAAKKAAVEAEGGGTTPVAESAPASGAPAEGAGSDEVGVDPLVAVAAYHKSKAEALSTQLNRLELVLGLNKPEVEGEGGEDAPPTD